MERFINPNLLHQQTQTRFIESLLELENQHLLIENTLAESYFQGAMHAYAIFYDDTKILRMSPYFDTEFKKKHKDCELLFIKTKSQKNDKSISLLHLFADFAIDNSDKILKYHFTTEDNYLEIQL